jgi:hypothetical protein
VPLLDQSFDELRLQLKHGQCLNHAGMDPVYYLVFRPEVMLEVKKRLKIWTAKLRKEGWDVNVFSMAEAVHGIIKNHTLRQLWLKGEEEDPLDFEAINKTISDVLLKAERLKKVFLHKLTSLRNHPNALLFVTDLEALHPYLRIGMLENQLQGKFIAPTVILYPGIRTGRTTLKFLGIYPEDPGYRSIHIGG